MMASRYFSNKKTEDGRPEFLHVFFGLPASDLGQKTIYGYSG